MLRLSRLGDYATLIMARMAREPARRFSAAELAAVIGIGPATVSKLLKRLAHEGLVASQRGVRGGYALAYPPEDITLAQIIDAIEGRIAMTECSAHAGLCSQETGCQVRVAWLRVNDLVRGTLETVKLAEFARPLPAPVRVVEHRHPAAGQPLGPTA